MGFLNDLLKSLEEHQICFEDVQSIEDFTDNVRTLINDDSVDIREVELDNECKDSSR